jgi:hypothetical protein
MIDCSKCMHHNCCRHVIPELAIPGTTICRFFDEETGLCSIYEHRPPICNTDTMFEHYFSKFMTREEYDKKNEEACKQLGL